MEEGTQRLEEPEIGRTSVMQCPLDMAGSSTYELLAAVMAIQDLHRIDLVNNTEDLGKGDSQDPASSLEATVVD